MKKECSGIQSPRDGSNFHDQQESLPQHIDHSAKEFWSSYKRPTEIYMICSDAITQIKGRLLPCLE